MSCDSVELCWLSNSALDVALQWVECVCMCVCVPYVVLRSCYYVIVYEHFQYIVLYVHELVHTCVHIRVLCFLFTERNIPVSLCVSHLLSR